MKTENRVGHLKGEFDVQSTFEGDNNVLMQQVISNNLLFDWFSSNQFETIELLALICEIRLARYSLQNIWQLRRRSNHLKDWD